MRLTNARFEKINQSLDQIHVKLGGDGKKMSLELKNEIFQKLSEDQIRLGKKYTKEHQVEVISEVLKRFVVE